MSGDGPSSSRQPPRFVPTLTAVVDLQEEGAPAAAPAAGPAPLMPDLAALPSLDLPAGSGAAAPPAALPPPAAQTLPPTLLRQASAPWESANVQQPVVRAPVPSPVNAPPPVKPASLPVLETVFEPAAPTAPVAPPPPQDAAPPTAAPSFKALPVREEADAFRIEEELLHRVLQRMDLSLEERLTDAVSLAVQQQLDAMIPRLRQEVEAVLRQLVVEAMAHELSEPPGNPGV
ncbi:hypothetical protein PGB34_14640 [Xenophilus arseniciresistens]|uniref:Uncharacterized protein n=1 Tax=Xenophilus arseniciresistens TaxID=1283306 RepID=A0AAE3NC31_9BURK|nr:hypothetical protein [Xenophilus arseniciresistens]MDA7417597.1 hypothetical protein [Xenophilus arseniciresistens]